MKIKSIAPWFGGKRSLAPKIVELLGSHKQYFEPFCGSAAVLFAKPASKQETVNDLHWDLTNLAWCLQDEARAVEIYDRFQRTLFSEDMIRSFWRELSAPSESEEVDTDRAYKYLVFSWAMRNGVSGTSRVRGNGFQMAVRWTAGGGSPTVRFRSVGESIPDWHARLQNVVIMRRDAFDIIPRFDDADGVSIYVDPPYHAESRTGYAAAGATSRYLHEFEHDNPLFGDDHRRLRDELHRFQKARVVVSYYDCEPIRQLYDGWDFVDVSRMKNLHQQNGRGARRQQAPELLIVNQRGQA